MSASKRLIPRDVTVEACPFCLTVPAQSQKGFASHVGKHQQEISLAALPNLDDSGGESSSGESDGNDDHSDAASDIEGGGNESADGDGKSLDSDGSGRTITSLTENTNIKRQELTSSNQEESGPAEEDSEDSIADQSTIVCSISTVEKFSADYLGSYD